MPAVTPANIEIRKGLRDIVHHSVRLNDQLESVIMVKIKQQGGFHGKISHSPPPWYTPVANAVLDLHALARKLESSLRYELNLPARNRGGSGENTIRALRAIPRLCEGTDDYAVHLCTKELRKWSSRAEISLNLREMPQRLPRSPGNPEPACPMCKNRTLRMWSQDLDGRGNIRCLNPACRDENGSRTSAQLEFFHGEFVFRWQDGIIGNP